MPTEEELRERLRVLAEASALPVPPVEIEHDPRGRLLPARVRRGDDGDPVIAVSSALLGASVEEQIWHLAACLGFWASPEPRRRRREGWLALALPAVAYVGFGLAELFENVLLPKPVLFVTGPVLGLLLALGFAAHSRRFQRALDETGRSVLEKAGHHPPTVARTVFGSRPDPSWWAQLRSGEPAPSDRVAAAGGGGTGVHPPLY